MLGENSCESALHENIGDIHLTRRDKQSTRSRKMENATTLVEVELNLSGVLAWKLANQGASEFAANVDAIYLVGYTEDELNGMAMDRDELAKEIHDNS